MKLLIAGFLATASIATFALAEQPKPQASVTAPMEVAEGPAPPSLEAVAESTAGPTVIPDGRAMASDAEVGQARRAYRAACERTESHGFCECVTAGVAQALAPADVRLAARTIRERLSAQGSTPAATQSDTAAQSEPTMTRIEQVEAHYADACAQFR